MRRDNEDNELADVKVGESEEAESLVAVSGSAAIARCFHIRTSSAAMRKRRQFLVAGRRQRQTIYHQRRGHIEQWCDATS